MFFPKKYFSLNEHFQQLAKAAAIFCPIQWFLEWQTEKFIFDNLNFI